jgi:clan AA aspartic protease (TIGR02281 family)
MMIRRRRWHTLAVALALTAALPVPSVAQDWPTQPVKIVIGAAAGSGLDAMTRMVATPLGERLGQPVLVENEPGEGGRAAARRVAAAPKDGYTAYLDSYTRVLQTLLTQTPRARGGAAPSFEPVGLVTAYPAVIAVRRDHPSQTLQELMASAKSAPGQIRIASGPVGTTRYLSGALLRDVTSLQFKHIEYADPAAAVAAVQSKEADALLDALPLLLRPLRQNQLRALAVSARERHPELPAVPTFAEAGLDGYAARFWYGLSFPAGTPRAIVERANKALSGVLAAEPVRRRFHSAGAIVDSQAPADFAQYLASDTKTWQAVLQKPLSTVLPTPPQLPGNPRSVVLTGDRGGYFFVDGRIDGRDIRFLVDTGASRVALTARDAARIGIQPKKSDYTVRTRTANGTGRAAPAHIASLQVGNITVRNVPALVVDTLHVSLLGMSFLSKLRFTQEEGKLVLEQ